MNGQGARAQVHKVDVIARFVEYVSFTYDAAGNVASVLDSVDVELAQSYAYDALGQLTSAADVSSDLVAYWPLAETNGTN